MSVPPPSARAESGPARILLEAAQRVLVIRSDDLGDNIMASGLPGALAASIDAKCGLVANPTALDLMVTDSLDFVAGVDCRPGGYLDVWRAGNRIRRAINQFDPDVVVLPHFDFEREAVAVALAGRRRTVISWSVAATAKRKRRNWWLRTLPGPRLDATGAPVHEFARLQEFGRFIGLDPEMLSPTLRADLTGPFPPSSVLASASAPLVAVGIGAAQGRRRWPLERFASVVRQLGDAGYTSILTGAPDEREQARQVMRALPKGAPVIDLVGQLPIAETARVIARSALYLGNDSGIGHIAAALGIKTVTISCHPPGAPADHVNAPERYRPVGDHSVVVRPTRANRPECVNGCVPVDEPCCVTQVPIEAVFDVCLAQLTGTPAAQQVAP